VYNNYYSNWSSYAVGSSIDSQVIVENNVFEPGSQTADDEKDIAQDRVGEDPRGGFARTINNLLLNGARERSISPDKVFTRPYTSNIETASESLKQSLLAEAGFRSPGFFEQKFGATIHNYDTDLNHDGATNTTDLTFCISEYGTSGQNLICDLDKDGFVNAVDYSGVIEGFNQN
jgi:hypothetical protein